jgi:hypothetical protein
MRLGAYAMVVCDYWTFCGEYSKYPQNVIHANDPGQHGIRLSRHDPRGQSQPSPTHLNHLHASKQHGAHEHVKPVIESRSRW